MRSTPSRAAAALALIGICSASLASAPLLRDPFTLRLAIDDERAIEYQVPASPYVVAPGAVQLYPGEELLLECTLESKSIVGFEVVDVPRHPKRTLIVYFKQVKKNDGQLVMILYVENPFEENLGFDMIAFPLSKGGWVEQEAWPIEAGGAGSELWDEPVLTLTLYNFRLGVELE
jgi:hypothetical protein